MREKIDDRLGDPIWWNDALQIFKTVLAAVTAWVLAASVLELPQPFLAPWSALLVVALLMSIGAIPFNSKRG